jgi:diaminopimelate epimerase
MRFVKMEGLGNDFVVLDQAVEVDRALVRRLCDRHFGVGADGVLRVGVDGSTVVMDYWNADGSTAEMCGNGLRCVALYAYDEGLVNSQSFVVRTMIGPRRVEVGEEIKVELGPVSVDEPRVWRGITFYPASVGNPHLVSLGEDPSDIDVASIGRTLDAETPGGVNVGFGALDREAIRLRVWERGVGETLACGSAMVAAGAVASFLGLVERSVDLHVRGGEATVELEDDTTWLTGPARHVFRGEFV